MYSNRFFVSAASVLLFSALLAGLAAPNTSNEGPVARLPEDPHEPIRVVIRSTDTPTPTPTPTDTPTPTPTCTPTPTNTPTPTPTPTPGEEPPCVFRLRDRGDIRETASRDTQMFYGPYRDQLVGLGCYMTWVEGLLANYLNTHEKLGLDRQEMLEYLRDPIAWSFGVASAEATKLSSAQWYGFLHKLDDSLHKALGQRGVWRSGVRYVYLTSSCEVLNQMPREASFCDLDYRFEASPISLLLNPDSSITGQLSYVQFPIDPNKKGRWYSWHASSQTPLLVFDPEHTGSVSSGAQLFGNWTVLGEKFTPARLGGEYSESQQRWEHGYQPLARLDLNGDGKISEEELAPLALWFDDNRDGVVQDGEIKRLAEVDIVELYYQPDHTDTSTGAIYASKGFARIVDGRKVYGPSVDWFAESAAMRSELIARDMMRKLSRSIVPEAQAAEPVKRPQLHAKETKFDWVKSFNGVWLWKVVDEDIATLGYQAGGILTFSDTPQGITGHSYVEAPLDKNEYNAAAVILNYPLEIKKKESIEDGDTLLHFDVNSAGETVRTTVALSKDAKSLNGKSTRISKSGDEVYSYSWTAVRFAPSS